MTASIPVDIMALEGALYTEITDETGATGITRESLLSDLDIDSLSFSEIVMNLERRLGTGIDIIESFEIGRETTVDELLTAIAAAIAVH